MENNFLKSIITEILPNTKRMLERKQKQLEEEEKKKERYNYN
ncbi:unnamed protein product [Paramecium sonneborni]|uniref:Uncharacterized protein n=1 Tax=Paramecium sonneborni TaxID=65129 RepID=A0A8S1KBD8_9CILI|nr:unnamed protein product [Paramecium sonneborni]